MFYDRFIQLCEQKGVKPTRAAIENGIARSAVSNWKSNWAQGIESLPSTANANALADYFDVSVDYLLGNVSEPYFHLDNQRIADEINSLDGYKKEPGQKAEPNNDYEEHILMLARKAEDIPKEQRDRIIQNFADTIDIYLAAKGLKKEDP